MMLPRVIRLSVLPLIAGLLAGYALHGHRWVLAFIVLIVVLCMPIRWRIRRKR